MSSSACSTCSAASGRAGSSIVGCEPASVDYGMGLSEPVAAAVDEAVRVVLELVTDGQAWRSGAAASTLTQVERRCQWRRGRLRAP